MLKLEKVSRKRDISITVRRKEKKLNRTFLLALGAALGIHIFGAVLFHIAPFKIGYQESIIPPVTVAIDISGFGSQWETMAAIHDEKSIPTYLLLPVTFEPALPSLPETVLMRDLGTAAPRTFKHSPFIALDRARAPLSTPALNGFSNEAGELKITLAGPLADKKLKPSNPHIFLSYAEFSSTLTFDVRIDDRSGEICWFREKDNTCSSEMLTAAVECLKALRFEEDKEHFLTVGEIRLFIPREKGSE